MLRVEPSLNRAVAMSHALRLVKFEKGISILLTESGEKTVAAIVKDSSILTEEIMFLREIAPKMTESLMKRVWRLEDLP